MDALVTECSWGWLLLWFGGDCCGRHTLLSLGDEWRVGQCMCTKRALLWFGKGLCMDLGPDALGNGCFQTWNPFFLFGHAGGFGPDMLQLVITVVGQTGSGRHEQTVGIPQGLESRV